MHNSAEIKTKIYQINKSDIHTVTEEEFKINQSDESSIFLYNITTSDRAEAVKVLKSFDIDSKVFEHILKPSENIRFKVLADTTYGELTYFYPGLDPIKYIGVVGFKKIIFLIHDSEEKLIEETLLGISTYIDYERNKIATEFLLYFLIHEILTSFGKIILAFREEIEVFAKDFDKNFDEIEPEKLLNLKFQLSDFSRVFEKLHFTLNFPPVKDILDKESTYHIYFNELLKTIEILKFSLTKAEDRIDSLHSHYLLLLQDKSNKRINFLTIIQAIFVPLTLLAGIYGMNFQNMPELGFKYGYFVTLGIMVLVALGFLRYFYKHGWFD